jgi:actin-like ATPase involved in cell morphogenesis
MSSLAHLGIEYSDTGLRIAVLFDGRLERIVLPMIEHEVLLDRHHNTGSLGVSFPGLFRLVGTAGTRGAGDILPRIFSAIRDTVMRSLKKQIGRVTIAVPTRLMSVGRSILLNSAATAGFEDVELIDVSIPSAVVYSTAADAATTQLVYYLGYGECEFALLRVVPGRVSVIDTGIVASASDQQFDAQLIEAIVLALRERSVFLGLQAFRSQQWLEFQRIAAKARKDLGRNPAIDVVLPQMLVGSSRTVRLTLSGAGLAARMAPIIQTTIEDVGAMLEQNEIKPSELDAVIALGDTATRYPVAAMLAQAFPGKVRVGEAGLIAAAAANYSAWLERGSGKSGQIDRHLSLYLSPYQAQPALSIDQLDGKSSAPPVVSDIAVDEVVSAGGIVRAVDPNAVVASREASTTDAGSSNADDESATAVTAAKELIERGRSLIEEAGRLLQNVESRQGTVEAKDDEPLEKTAAQLFMSQAEEFITRGRYLDAVALAHRAYQEDNLDAATLAGMLRIHVLAGLAMDKPEQYSDAIQTLMCAHSHDQTDKSVHRALAARHLRHAQAMKERDPKSAMAAVKDALRFDPKHEESQALFDLLTKLNANKAQ